MLERRLPILLSILLVAWLSPSLSACGGSTAGYTRARRAVSEGRRVAAEEVRAADFIAYVATDDAPRPATSAGPLLPVLLDARLGATVVSTGGDRVLVQVSLRGGTAAVRTPSRMVLIVDVSGSMQDGDKIGAVRHALARFVETLDPADQIAIVTFADEAHVALAPTSVASSRDVILSAVGSLSAYGGTNLDAGMSAGLTLAASMRDAGSVTRVLLLSDGIASVGRTDAATLAGYGDTAHAIDVALTTVGMGDQIDFALLEALATRSGGAFHYLDQPSEVERLFATEIRSLVSLAARDVRVRIRLPAGTTLLQSYDERTHFVGDVLETAIGDLGSDDAAVVVHELALEPGVVPLALPVEITLAGPDGGAAVVASTSLAAVRGDAHAVPTDLAVLRNATLGRLAVALRAASAACDRGDTAEAWYTLTSALDASDAARAALLAAGDAERARSLDEATGMVQRARDLVPRPAPSAAPPPASGWTVTSPGSASFSGWR